MPDDFPKNDGVLSTEQRLNRICEIWNDEFVSEFESLRKAASYTTGDAKTTVSTSVSYLPGRGDVTIDVNATGGARTVTFTPTPIDGQTHTVCKNDASGNAVTVDGGDYNINGAATDAIGTQYLCKTYRFIGGANEWRIISSS
jgi:hypothetical protein